MVIVGPVGDDSPPSVVYLSEKPLFEFRGNPLTEAGGVQVVFVETEIQSPPSNCRLRVRSSLGVSDSIRRQIEESEFLFP